MSRPLNYVDAPPVIPLPFGLFSAAIVTDDLTAERQFGVAYEPLACGPAGVANAVCDDPPAFGTLSASVDNAREVTLTGTGEPANTVYTIEWGDGDAEDVQTLDGATHTYAADGTYTIIVTDLTGRGYSVAVTGVTVTNGAASGPFTGTAGFAKQVTDGIDDTIGDPFVAYSILRCSPVGLTGTTLEERALGNLRLGEQRAAESFLAGRLAATGLAITGAAAVEPEEGLAIAEQWAAAKYGGVPVIHTPRGVASLLATRTAIARSDNGRMESHLGAIVAAGGGYAALKGPGGVPAGVGEAWLYVTGTVTVRRAPTPETVPMTMSRVPATNEAMAMAERPYVVATECVVGAVLVKSPAGNVGSPEVLTAGGPSS